jgi:hypothetical protein
MVGIKAGLSDKSKCVSLSETASEMIPEEFNEKRKIFVFWMVGA